MSVPKMSIISILADILAVLIPATIVSEKYSIYFCAITGLDVLILTCVSIIYLIKNEGEFNIEKLLNGKKFITGLFWTAGAVIWAINKVWSGAIIWIILAILLFVSGFCKSKRNPESV